MFSNRRMIVLLAVIVLLATAASPKGADAQIDLKAEAQALLAQQLGVPAESLESVGEDAEVGYPLQGRSIYEYKFMDAEGTVHTIAGDEMGQVDVAGMDAGEAAAYASEFGKLDRELVQALVNAGMDDVVEVNIWLKMPEGSGESFLDKPEVDGGAFQQEFATREEGVATAQAMTESDIAFDAEAWDATEAEASEQAISRVEAVTAPFADELRAQGYEVSVNKLVPMINVKMPVRAIIGYATNEQVEGIYPGAQLGEELNVARQVVGAHLVNSLGITGAGSRIAVVEYGGIVPTTHPYLAGTVRDNLYNCSVATHVTGISGLIRSTHPTYKGVAPGTSLWVGCGQTDAQVQAMANRANTWGADTFSLSWYSSVTRTPTAMDKFFDTFMFTYFDLVTKSAGNRGQSDGWVTPPGLGYNTFTIGNFDDRNTVAVAGDIMAPSSSFVDPISAHNDREKPEAAAPGTNIISTLPSSPWVGNIGTGTSYSGPLVAGISSLMYHRNGGLKAWPESTKAIIMATAIYNKEGATRLSEKDGAGGVWASEADWVARNNTIYGRWGGVSYSCATGTNWNVTTMYLYAGYKTRVVIVWDQNPNYAYYASKPSADIDLQIYSPSNALVTGSYSWDNTYEIVEFTPTTTGYYKLQLDKVSCYLTPAYLGWAWSQP